MKSNYPPILFLICLCVACQKNNTPANGNGGNNGNGGSNGNGGVSDTLSVASFSPQTPYSSDVVTITGTGFNPDKTKDSVYFHNEEGSGYFSIVSASGTQLKCQLPPDSVSQILTVGSNGVLDIKISANGKSKSIPKAIRFKMTLSLFGIVVPGHFGVPRPGDSMTVRGRGFTWNSTGIAINGQSFPVIKLDSGGVQGDGVYSNQWYAYTYMPKAFFGASNNEDSTKTVALSVTNGDGKVAQMMVAFGISPIMEVDNYYYDGQYLAGGGVQTISIGNANANGGVFRLHVIGKNLKNDADVHLTGNDGTDAHSSLPVSGFQDSTIIEFGASGMKPGYTYNVAITANNSSKGSLYYGSHTIYVAP